MKKLPTADLNRQQRKERIRKVEAKLNGIPCMYANSGYKNCEKYAVGYANSPMPIRGCFNCIKTRAIFHGLKIYPIEELL